MGLSLFGILISFQGRLLISNIQASLFYPLGFLFYLMPSDQAYGYTVVIHCLLGSVFMYSFMRTLSISRGGSLLSAFVFTFSGFFMGHLYAGHLTFIQNYIWIPLVFRYLHLFVHTRRLLFGLRSRIRPRDSDPGRVSADFILYYPGRPGFSLFPRSPLSESSPMGRRVEDGVWGGRRAARRVRACRVQVAPTLEFSRLSTRGEGLNYAMATYESLDPKELLAFLIPDIFGSAVDQTYWKSRDAWHFWESCGYVGILPCGLPLCGPESRLSGGCALFFSS